MNLAIREQDLIEVERAYCARGVANFNKRAWPHFDPQPYEHGWHMDAIGEHLQACANREITRLLINVPPGTSKSTLTCVTFPAWLWGPFGWPQAKFIGASYESTLASRDNRRTRILIDSEWYQSRWPTPLTSDQNEKTFFENTARGFRQSSAVTSMTGRRGDFVVWDDPLSPEKAYSDQNRSTAIRVFQETLPLRLVSPEHSVIVVIMQRLHQNDVAGHILESDYGYEHLMLPMEFEPERRCYTVIQPKHFASEKVLARHHAPSQRWFTLGSEVPAEDRDIVAVLPWREVWNQDPRKDDGDLLMPNRFSHEVVERDKKVMGAFATAGQFQQRPTPRQGGLFTTGMIEVIPERPAGLRLVRAWDFAATTEKESSDAAYTAGGLLGEAPDGSFVICDMKRERLSPGGVRTLLKNTASQDGRGVVGSIPQDPGQSGKAQAQQMIASLAGYRYRASPESGDKVTRAEPLASQVEAGNVKMVAGPWNKDLLEEMQMFPAGKFKDQIDALSRAFMELTLRKRGGSSTTAD